MIIQHIAVTSSPLEWYLTIKNYFIPAFRFSISHAQRLASLVDTKGQDVRVDHGKVEGRQRHVGVGDGDEHGAVDDLLAVLVNGGVGLVGVAGVGAGHSQRRVGKVELGGPSNVGRLASDVGDRGDVAVVGADGLAWSVPFQQDLLAREG